MAVTESPSAPSVRRTDVSSINPSADQQIITHHDRSSGSPPTRHIASPTPGLGNEATARLLMNRMRSHRPEYAVEVAFARPELSPIPHDRLHPPGNAHPSPPRELETRNFQPAWTSNPDCTVPSCTNNAPAQSGSNDSAFSSVIPGLESPLIDIPSTDSSQMQASTRPHPGSTLDSRQSTNETELAPDDRDVRPSGPELVLPASNVGRGLAALRSASPELTTRSGHTNYPPVHRPVSEADRAARRFVHGLMAVPKLSLAAKVAGLQHVPVTHQSHQAGLGPPTGPVSRPMSASQSQQAQPPASCIPTAVPGLAPGPRFQSSRGRRVHARMACNNCRAAHLGCDDGGFPCIRCRNTGKTGCRPVLHQPRGRQRLVGRRCTQSSTPTCEASASTSQSAAHQVTSLEPTMPVSQRVSAFSAQRRSYHNPDPLPAVIMDSDLRILRINSSFAEYIADQDTIKGDNIFEFASVLPFSNGRKCRHALEHAIHNLYPGYQPPTRRTMARFAELIDIDGVQRVTVGFQYPLRLSFRRDVEPFDLIADAWLRLAPHGSMLYTYLILHNIESLAPCYDTISGPRADSQMQMESAVPSDRTRLHETEPFRYPGMFESTSASSRSCHRGSERFETGYGSVPAVPFQAPSQSLFVPLSGDPSIGRETASMIFQSLGPRYLASGGRAYSPRAPERCVPRSPCTNGTRDDGADGARQHDAGMFAQNQSIFESHRQSDQSGAEYDDNRSVSTIPGPYRPSTPVCGATDVTTCAARATQSPHTTPPPFKEPPLHTRPRLPMIRSVGRISADWAPSDRRRDILGCRLDDLLDESSYRASPARPVSDAAARSHRPRSPWPDYPIQSIQHARLASEVLRSPRRWPKWDARRPEERGPRGVESSKRKLDLEHGEIGLDADGQRRRLDDGE